MWFNRVVQTGKTILLLSGPNLALLGTREPQIYGRQTLAELVAIFESSVSGSGYLVEHVNSEQEAELVSAVHRARGSTVAIVANPGALTHYGWSLHDALAAFEGPVVELHISNPEKRESWRHTSVISPVATGQIVGFGALGYQLAGTAVLGLLEGESSK